jgi:hypothetical protein
MGEKNFAFYYPDKVPKELPSRLNAFVSPLQLAQVKLCGPPETTELP